MPTHRAEAPTRRVFQGAALGPSSAISSGRESRRQRQSPVRLPSSAPGSFFTIFVWSMLMLRLDPNEKVTITARLGPSPTAPPPVAS